VEESRADPLEEAVRERAGLRALDDDSNGELTG
jgi:hypothetical protein